MYRRAKTSSSSSSSKLLTSRPTSKALTTTSRSSSSSSSSPITISASSSTSFSMLTLLYVLLVILNLTWGAGVPFERKLHFRQSGTKQLQIANQWKLLTFNFQPDAPVNDLNFYNPNNVLITGIAIGYDRIFMATPKLFSGVPTSVSFVSKSEFGNSPTLQAYPDWSFSTTARNDFNCSDLALVSVYRLRIDSCNRLWVLDAGISRSLEDYEVTCPPKILVIDLNTNLVLRRIDFPPEILRGESLFTNLVIDETTSKPGSRCDDVYVYITDTVEPAIVVYDSGRDVTWRLTHPAMYPDPDFAQSEILNDRFILMDGVVGLTFDEKSGTVYFQPLATDRVFSISKEALRAGPLAQNQILPVKLVGRKTSQGIGLAISPVDSSLIFSPLSETAIATWNPQTNLQSILAYDRDNLQFVADISPSRTEPGVIYAISSKFHRFFLKNLDTNEFNNRVLRIELSDTEVPADTALSPFSANLPGYIGKPGLPIPFGNYYQHSNSLDKINTSPTYLPGRSSSNSYFSSSPTAPTPYQFEPVGVINYSLGNPFNSLNQGEAFPPTKEHRNAGSLHTSFLDSLSTRGARITPIPTVAIPATTTTTSALARVNHALGRNYFYRSLRSAKKNDDEAEKKEQ